MHSSSQLVWRSYFDRIVPRRERSLTPSSLTEPMMLMEFQQKALPRKHQESCMMGSRCQTTSRYLHQQQWCC